MEGGGPRGGGGRGSELEVEDISRAQFEASAANKESFFARKMAENESRPDGQGTVAYYLLLDNRFRVSSGYLGAEFQETVESSFNRLHECDPASSPVAHRLPGYMEFQGMPSSPFRQQFPVERKWALGLQVNISLAS